MQLLTGVAAQHHFVSDRLQMAKNACEDLGEFIWEIIRFIFVLAIYKTRVLPTVHLDQLFVPTLNSTRNLTQTIYINLRLKNRNQVTGVYYDDPVYVNITFFPRDQNTSIALGEYGMHGFYQGNGKAKRIMGPLPTRGLPPSVITDGGVNRTQLPVGFFRVDFIANVRHKVDGYHQRHRLLLSANIEFNGITMGNQFDKKGIRLVKSDAWYDKRPPIIVVLVSILFSIIII
ncbi:uncharacterized protein LOC112528127 [Cynara cardunculus var. scolymus]|uniref:uncharacterized protein LOC112528127 n=1 Tax=Cynara cardunculus var. scolymus TaxID=59895 RepID=UPI000D62F6B7|nr:uncharacterized protein LOC112528127 [Cynara cardunculus var. scolymus]